MTIYQSSIPNRYLAPFKFGYEIEKGYMNLTTFIWEKFVLHRMALAKLKLSTKFEVLKIARELKIKKSASLCGCFFIWRKWLAIINPYIKLINPHAKSLALPVIKVGQATKNLQNRVLWGSYGSFGHLKQEQIIYDFLLAFYRNYIPILCHFWYTVSYWSKIAYFIHPTVLGIIIGDDHYISRKPLES